MRETFISVAGVVAGDPRVVQLDDQRRITSFRLASTSRHKDAASGAWVDGPTVWTTVTCWRDLAVNAADCIRRRDRVLVHGRMRTRDWTTEQGHVRTTVEVDAESLGHDLAYGTTQFTRRPRALVVDRPERPQADELATRVTLDAEAEVGTPAAAVPAGPTPVGTRTGSGPGRARPTGDDGAGDEEEFDELEAELGAGIEEAALVGAGA